MSWTKKIRWFECLEVKSIELGDLSTKNERKREVLGKVGLLAMVNGWMAVPYSKWGIQKKRREFSFKVNDFLK